MKHIRKPAIIQAEGNMPKEIKEYFGKINTNSNNISIAKMKSPRGWTEPEQTPEFDEYTVVLKGTLRVHVQYLDAKGQKDEWYDIKKGEAIVIRQRETVTYSTPYKNGCEYISVCIPAFSNNLVNRGK